MYSQTYSSKIPQKLTTTACFIQEESSGRRPPACKLAHSSCY